MSTRTVKQITALQRMLITIEYDGTGLVGWQRQNNGPSVQQFLEQAAEKLTTMPTLIQGAGRTDAGVHASAQAAHLDVPAHLSANAVVNGLNAWLESRQISVVAARPVAPTFNARFDAAGRAYRYRIYDQRQPAALRRNFVWHHHKALDTEPMQQAAQHLVGKHDFTSFRARACQARSPVRSLNNLEVARRGDEVHITAYAPSFLHHQIRNIAGTLALVGSGKWQPDDVRTALLAKDRSAAGPTAPPQGLCLTDIVYPEALLAARPPVSPPVSP